MKSKRKKIVLSSLAMLIIATMALTSTTYAWFTTGNTASVETFEFTADKASGLQLSADVSNWKSSITAIDIAEAVAASPSVYQVGAKFGTVSGTGSTKKFEQGTVFTPISTVGDVDSTTGMINFFSSESNADGTRKTEAYTGDSAKGYYLFNVYVNNMSTEAKGLVLTSKSVWGDALANKDNKTQYATRIAFVDQGSTTKNAAIATVKTNAAGLVAHKKVTIIEPNSTNHTTDAINLLGVSDGTAYATYGVKATDNKLTTTNGFLDEKANVVVKTITTDDTNTEIAELPANSIVKLTVFVWIEGQDIDCNNDVAEGAVKVLMGFTAKDKKTVTYATDNTATATKYTVSVTENQKTKAADLAKTSFTAPTGQGLLGWVDDISKTTPDHLVGADITVNSDMTLYPIYKNQWTITFSASDPDVDASTIPASVTVFEGDSYTIPTATPTRTGYTFEKWQISGADAPATITNVTADTTLTAVWTLDSTP